MTLTSKDDYLKASNRLATGFGPTVDFTDAQVGSTVQSEGGVPTPASDLPGQVFTVDQLPDPAVAVAYGLPPVRVPAHLILDDAEDGAKHIQAKTAEDLLNGQLREELGNPVLSYDNTVRTADASLTSFSDRTGANAFGALAGSDGTAEDNADEVFVDGILGGDGESATGGIDGPIDPAGVQRDPETGEPVSAEAGNQGQQVSDAPGGPDSAQPDGPVQAEEGDKPNETAADEPTSRKGRR